MAWHDWLTGRQSSDQSKALNGVSGGGWMRVLESFGGAWQKNIEVDHKSVLAFPAVFSCMTLIARDIAKLRVKLEEQKDGIWVETDKAAFTPVLRRPNHFQTRNQFWENWMLSKLSRGNTYVLLKRDNRGVVNGMYVLDPDRCRPLVSDDGAVFYELQADNIAGLNGGPVIVPANEIIHDRFNCLFHPLIGLSPIYANGLAATQGLKIQQNSANFFQNGSRPGGLLIAPGKLDPDNAVKMKEYWDTNFAGDNAGKIAILSDGLQYHGLAVTATDAQLIEQLGWSAETVCSTFHVPPYKVGIGPLPTYDNVEALNIEYYSNCLHAHIEEIVEAFDHALGIGWGRGFGIEFDTENLMRMDSVKRMEVLERSKGKLTVNEQRAQLERLPIEGGDTVFLQEQDHSLEWLARRDALPFEAPKPADTPAPANDVAEPDAKFVAAFAGQSLRRMLAQA